MASNITPEQKDSAKALKGAYRTWRNTDVGRDLYDFIEAAEQHHISVALVNATNGVSDGSLAALQNASAYRTIKLYIDRQVEPPSK